MSAVWGPLQEIIEGPAAVVVERPSPLLPELVVERQYQRPRWAASEMQVRRVDLDVVDLVAQDVVGVIFPNNELVVLEGSRGRQGANARIPTSEQ